MTLEEKFEIYHNENPKIFKLLIKYAREAKRSGFNTYGVKAIFERIRWYIDVETRDPEGFKLNNNYTSRYARKLEEKYPKNFKDFFRKRELRS